MYCWYNFNDQRAMTNNEGYQNTVATDLEKFPFLADGESERQVYSQ